MPSVGPSGIDCLGVREAQVARAAIHQQDPSTPLCEPHGSVRRFGLALPSARMSEIHDWPRQLPEVLLLGANQPEFLGVAAQVFHALDEHPA